MLVTRFRAQAVLALVLVMLGMAATAGAAWLRPLDGIGNFYFTCDAVTLPRPDAGVDVVAMVAVSHGEITFENEAGLWQARVRATATVTGLDGTTTTATTTHRLTTRSAEEAQLRTLAQTFTVVLKDVRARAGQFEIVVEDLNRQRPGLQYLVSGERAMATATTDWFAMPARETRGLAVGDVVYLAHAPIRDWERDGRPTVPGQGGPWEFVNPQRRYGLEAEAVQLYFTIEPPARVEDRRRAATRPLLATIQSDELDFALRDTIAITAAVQRSLASGNAAAVYWEMDAGGLPPGSYRLGIAPIDSVGRSLLSSFSVVWSLDQLARPTELVLGEGRTVFVGAARDAFEDASRAEREEMLADFWREHDPTPDDPYNEARAEFRRRITYVDNFLGGFGPEGALDPRGRIYLLLGEPDEVEEEALPLNEDYVNTARERVFNRYAVIAAGSEGTEPWDFSDYVGGSPGASTLTQFRFLPYHYMTDLHEQKNRASDNTRGFLFWGYDEAGDQLFLNTYSGHGGGLRFLFVDPTGMGRYKLDASNVREPAD
jgi:GWxTD domain-containing protein